MKLKKLLLGTFATIALCTTFASCTKNEDTPNDGNSKIELPSKEDMSYMKKYDNYMSNLLSQKQDDMSL